MHYETALSLLCRASIADDAVLEAWIKDEKEKMIHHHHHLEEQKFLSPRFASVQCNLRQIRRTQGSRLHSLLDHWSRVCLLDMSEIFEGFAAVLQIEKGVRGRLPAKLLQMIRGPLAISF